MIKLRLKDLPDIRQGHFLRGLAPGEFLCAGALSYKAPNVRTHSADGPDGSDRHIHDDAEVFVILQGKAMMELNGVLHPMVTGDVFIVEPGEDHHLISDADDPCVNLWLHAGAHRHPDQLAQPKG
jgi:mannose-6-phosphate isomerase-like protein (cupin superfamily)